MISPFIIDFSHKSEIRILHNKKSDRNILVTYSNHILIYADAFKSKNKARSAIVLQFKYPQYLVIVSLSEDFSMLSAEPYTIYLAQQ